jgi:predicted ArsR family transcriptional regulator
LFNSKSVVSLKKQIEIMKTEKNPKGAGRPSKTYKQKNLQKKVPLEMFRECIEALNVICKDYEKKHL